MGGGGGKNKTFLLNSQFPKLYSPAKEEKRIRKCCIPEGKNSFPSLERFSGKGLRTSRRERKNILKQVNCDKSNFTEGRIIIMTKRTNLELI